MTQEQKAKAYDEALKLMKDCVPDEDGLVHIRPYDIFSELQEGKGERIKNLIYCLIRDRSDNGKLLEHNGISVEEALDWVEMQGEQKVLSLEQAANIFLDALSNSPYNNKPITDAQIITKQLLLFFQNSASYNPDALIENEQNFTWGEEDERILYNMRKYCGLCRSMSCCSNKCVDECIDWLKSLKDRAQPQPKQELSEEVELEKEIEKCLKRHNMLAVGKKDFTDIAKHFFELGLKAQKGE